MTGAFRSNPCQTLTFVRRRNWNTREQDFFTFTGQNEVPRFFVPGLVLLRDRLGRVRSMDKSPAWKLLVATLVLSLEVRRGVFVRCTRAVRTIVGDRRFRLLVTWVYWRFLHKENYVVFDEKRYIERMILRRFGSE